MSPYHRQKIVFFTSQIRKSNQANKPERDKTKSINIVLW